MAARFSQEQPFIVGIVGNLKPGQPDFSKLLKRFALNPLFRGIRVGVGLVKQLLDKNELADFKQLADLDLSLDVNGGPDTPAALAKLASQLPTLRIILNHIGNVRITKELPPAEWQAGIAQAPSNPMSLRRSPGSSRVPLMTIPRHHQISISTDLISTLSGKRSETNA